MKDEKTIRRRIRIESMRLAYNKIERLVKEMDVKSDKYDTGVCAEMVDGYVESFRDRVLDIIADLKTKIK